MKEKKGKKASLVPFGLGLLIFVLAFGAGVTSKVIQPSWSKTYSVQRSDEVGTLQSDLT